MQIFSKGSLIGITCTTFLKIPCPLTTVCMCPIRISRRGCKNMRLSEASRRALALSLEPLSIRSEQGCSTLGEVTWKAEAPPPYFLTHMALGREDIESPELGSVMYSVQTVSITPYSPKAVSLKLGPRVGMVGGTYISRTGKGWGAHECSGPALWSEVVTSSRWPPPTVCHQKHNP